MLLLYAKPPLTQTVSEIPQQEITFPQPIYGATSIIYYLKPLSQVKLSAYYLQYVICKLPVMITVAGMQAPRYHASPWNNKNAP